MITYQIKHFVFSSSILVHGMPYKEQLQEIYVPFPVVFQGNSKLIIEQALEDFYKAYDLRYMSLHYHNAIGAHTDGKIGEDHRPETHIVPNVLLHIVKKQEESFMIDGGYGTKDGSAVGDYVHVMDVAKAHVLALHSLLDSSV